MTTQHKQPWSRAWRMMCLAGVIGLSLAIPAEAWAQGKKNASKQEEEKSKSLTMPYVVTILLIGIGVATVCVGGPRQSGNLDRDLA